MSHIRFYFLIFAIILQFKIGFAAFQAGRKTIKLKNKGLNTSVVLENEGSPF